MSSDFNIIRTFSVKDLRTLLCSNNKCLIPIAFYTQDKDGTQLFRGGKPIGKKIYGSSFHDKNGNVIQDGIPFVCPRCKAISWIQDTEECKAEQERLKYSYGQVCLYYPKEGAVCDRRQPCDCCIVYQNYNNKVGVTQ